MGGLPEEWGDAADEVASGSKVNSGPPAPASATSHLGEVKFSGSIRFFFFNLWPYLTFIHKVSWYRLVLGSYLLNPLPGFLSLVPQYDSGTAFSEFGNTNFLDSGTVIFIRYHTFFLVPVPHFLEFGTALD